MSRNGSGTFTILNPIAVGALRSSAAVNENFSDMGDEITNSFPSSGALAMLGQLKINDGTQALPGVAFAADRNTGFRRSGADEMEWISGSASRMRIAADGKVSLYGALNVVGSINASFGPQTMNYLLLNRLENSSNELTKKSYQSGNGSGSDASFRVVGSASNNIAVMRWVVNSVTVMEATQSLFTYGVNTDDVDTDGYIDFTRLTTVPAAGVNVARLHAGLTEFYANDTPVRPTNSYNVYTESATWVKPSTGTMAYVQVWSGGGAGGSDTGGYSAGGGGGGAYMERYIALTSLSANVAVTVGLGGASVTGADQLGGTGGESSFGAYLVVPGGAGGRAWSGSVNNGGGGAGCNTSGSGGTGFGGNPTGLISSSTWGGPNASNPFGGGGGDTLGVHGGQALYGGGGGGSSAAPPGDSVWGGGGGAASTGGAVGTSIFGGAGGSTGSAGTAPGGGGGGASYGASGAGARGEIRVTVW